MTTTNDTIDVEVIFDGDGDHLAEDVATMVHRHLEARGCDVLGTVSGYRDVAPAR